MTHATVYRFPRCYLSSVLLWPGNGPAASLPFRVRLQLEDDAFLSSPGCVRFRFLTRVLLKALEKAPVTIFHPHVNRVESITSKTICFCRHPWCILRKQSEDASFLPQSLVGSTLSNIVVGSKSLVYDYGLIFDVSHFLFPTSCPVPIPWPYKLFSPEQRWTTWPPWFVSPQA